MREVVIAEAVRTPIGTFGGTLKDVTAIEFGGLVIREVLKRAKVRPEKVDEVIMGNVLQAGQGQNPARQAAIRAGISQYIPSFTINKVCGSGMKAVLLATQAIKAGDAEIIVAGGMENMSEAPFILPHSRWGHRMGHDQMIDVVIQDGLWCSFGHTHMGITAENIATKFGFTREEQDEFAAKKPAEGRGRYQVGKVQGRNRSRGGHSKKGRSHPVRHGRISTVRDHCGKTGQVEARLFRTTAPSRPETAAASTTAGRRC